MYRGLKSVKIHYWETAKIIILALNLTPLAKMQLDWKQNAFWNNAYKGNLDYKVWEKSISWSKEVMRFLQTASWELR
jgi:hypothetical protein